jgi:ATP-dependent DNA ligase
MDLPVMLPVAPMLAKPVAQLPDGSYSVEPQWDGFRTVVFRDVEEVAGLTGDPTPGVGQGGAAPETCVP